MTIHELLAAAGLTANDEIPIWDAEATGEPTKKITAQQLAAAVVALANLVTSVNSQTGAVSITPANIGAVAKSGDTMTGRLTISLGVGDNQARIIFLSQGVAGQVHLIANTTGTQQMMTFRQFTPDGTSFEEYALPNTADYTGGPALRNILTDKSPVLVTQGGTGATTPAGARANLGIISGTAVATTDDSGLIRKAFSTYGLSERPNAIVLTLQSRAGIMRYNWDASVSELIYEVLKPDGAPLQNTTIRYGYIIIP
jgi:hypothetical protein